MKFTAPRRLHWLLLISAVILFLDRLTKDWVTRNIHYGDAIPVIPSVLRISHWTNDGAAFSLFANSASPHTVRWALIAFSSLAALVVLIVMIRLADRLTLTSVALALVLAGRWATCMTALHTVRWWTSSRCTSSVITGPTSTSPTPQSA